MTLKELYSVSQQSEIFVRKRKKTGESFAVRYVGGENWADKRVLSVTAKSYPMYKSVLEVILERAQ